jgi:glutaredoxin
MELIIYSRQGCHLCDVMKKELEAMNLGRSSMGQSSDSKPSTIKVIDIDNDPSLKKRYHDQIPVLFVNDVEICHHRLNKKRLVRFLDSD